MKRLEMVSTLLRKARQDEAVVETLVGDRKFDDETVGFHAQQAVEKLLKAWLSHLGADYPKVHRLETLLDLLGEQGKVLPGDLVEVTRLTPFATVFRYDDLPLAADIDRRGLAWAGAEGEGFRRGTGRAGSVDSYCQPRRYVPPLMTILNPRCLTRLPEAAAIRFHMARAPSARSTFCCMVARTSRSKPVAMSQSTRWR